MFYLHPNKELNQLFSAKPYQGVEPESAKYLFIGLDANFAPDIEYSPIFRNLMEYLQDGVKFWHNYGVHHPFLLTQYRGDGRFYHESFARIGFLAQHAAEVSFIELIHVPTCGRSSLTSADLSVSHLKRINDAILYGSAGYIFISGTVARLMRESGEFPWLPKYPLHCDLDGLKLWYQAHGKCIYWHYHLSVFGKFNNAKIKQLQAIREVTGIMH